MVTLDAFFMDAYEVTNAQYEECVKAGECTRPSDLSSLTHDEYYESSVYADYPVMYIDWGQARAYCHWVGRRLPTEAEWEYAARGGLVGMYYPWGDEFDGSLVNFCDEDCPLWGNTDYSDGYLDTGPVGSYPANGYGLFDIVGNVEEWVSDWFQPYSSRDAENPSGPPSGDERVTRGGSWLSPGHTLGVAFRSTYNPYDFDFTTGFRCVMAP